MSLGVAMVLAMALGSSKADHVVLLADGNGKPFVEAKAGLESAGFTVEGVKPDAPQLAERIKRAHAGETWLSLGPDSSRVLARVSVPRRAAALLRESEMPAGVSGVGLEVPAGRQVKWMKQAFPGRTRLIVLRRPGGGVVDDAQLQHAARENGMTLVLADVRHAGEAVPALETALRSNTRSALVWLAPDPVAVNSDTVGPLVQSALAYRVPVIGFSAYFLRAGALGAVVVDFGACARQAYALASSPTVVHQPPANARLVVDARLAERLGVTVQPGEGVELQR